MMVLSNRSQIPKFTERFFNQSGVFKYFQNTTYGISKFSVSDLKINYMGTRRIKLDKTPLTVYWRFDFCSDPGKKSQILLKYDLYIAVL
jgi:hypothetical protein